MEEIDYKKKIRTCEKLGAKKFQKVVFKVEDIKWKVVKKLIPNYISFGDKLIEKSRDKKIKRAKNEEEISAIKRNAALQKMALRKEYNNKENMNYHINKNKPTEFLRELNWNKNIHKRNLIWNSILLPTSIGLSIAGVWPAIPFAIYQVASTFINFQCVNVQNYNIYRIKRIEEKLKKKEEKDLEEKIEKYKDGYQVIGDKIEEKKDIVNIDEIVNSITSIDQLKQIRELLTNEQAKRNINKVDVTNKKGGK
ncbi:MAG: hypothetical protein Q4E69_02105 [Bacilli bacterium]|nr:hypothetical protein [Bacilli bacterium]